MLPRCSLLMLLGTFCVSSLRADENWPGWRGPRGDGQAQEIAPTFWNSKALVWKTALPGIGQSSPVIWGDRIFLTAALQEGKKRLVLCVDRKTGAILWQHEAWSGAPEPSHKMNGWASATCVTDGKRVVAFFGKGGIHCLSVDGKPMWSRDLGSFPGAWGTSACPIIVGDLVIQNCDAVEKASYLIGLDKNTGKTVWKTTRPYLEKGGWSTPVVVNSKGRTEIVLNGEPAVKGYDPATGKELWTCKSFAGRGEPTVVPSKDLLFVVNGLAGDIYAVRPGGDGDVTKTHMAWHTPRKGGRDQPSPIVVGNYLVVANMAGLTTCYDSGTGKELWKERLEGSFTASPIAAGGLVYFLNEAGETYVIEPGPKMKLVAENSLGAKGETFRASMAVCQGEIYARSHTHIYRIGRDKYRKPQGEVLRTLGID